MLVSAPRRHPITHVLGLIVLFSGCHKKSDAPAPGPGSAPAPAPVAAADAGTTQAPTPGPAKSAPIKLAKRCVLGGDPLPADCVAGGEGVVFGKDGLFYVVAGKQVNRYQRAPGDDCHFEPSGEPIQLPPDNPRPQSIDGPVYMRSGGAAWHLVRAGDAVYAHDYLGGLFRIDRGKPEPSCDDVFGFSTVASLGKKLVIARKGIEELRLGAKCTAASAKVDDKAHGDLFAVQGKLYLAAGSDLWRFDGTTRVPLAADERVCYVTGLTACGDGACIVDSNCMQIIQLAADGKVLRKLGSDQLFATRPWSIRTAATSDAGDVYVLAKHRDKTNDKEICEAAIYELPAAAFAL